MLPGWPAGRRTDELYGGPALQERLSGRAGLSPVRLDREGAGPRGAPAGKGQTLLQFIELFFSPGVRDHYFWPRDPIP